MHILLDNADPKTLSEVAERVHSRDGGKDSILSNLAEVGGPDLAGRRWVDLRLATVGARRWLREADESSPTFAGVLNEKTDLGELIADASYSEGKSKFFHEFGVNYTGRTNIDPRTVFVVDNKGGNKLHDPAKSPEIHNLLTALPDEWWCGNGIVSTGNIDKLADFLDMLSETLPLVYTDAAEAKLRHLGLDYVRVGVPRAEKTYGYEVREAAHRLSWRLWHEAGGSSV